ncbi:hypothetical protein AB0958_16155 [Streptomyces sp. NPDC006655]|uniref:hypothetical protein n=1 Tax=Streptomyces sp. NPDC006655 TaxID=3156898 RepID=UPI0034572477
MKLTRRITGAAVGAALACGVVLVGGGSAMAATSQVGDHHPVTGATAGVPAGAKGHGPARQPTDPWIADQLAAFYPSAAHRLAVFDPWVKDQLALSQSGR